MPSTPVFTFNGVQIGGPPTVPALGQLMVGDGNGGTVVVDPESRGAKLRRLAKIAARNNPYLRAVMKAAPPWQPSTQYYQSNVVAHGGNLFVAFSSGVSASSGGPTNLLPAGAVDNTTGWIYVGPNNVPNDPSLTFVTYTNSLSVTAGQLIVVGGARIYAVISAGALASTGTGPTGTGTAITDGSATLSYYGLYKPSPTIADWPTFSSQTSAPGGLTNTYSFASGTWQNVSAKSAKPVTGGTGYTVGDTLTVTGGTSSVAASFRVASVSGGVVMSVTLISGGTYTGLPQTPAATSSSGSGSGCTLAIKWPDPYFAKLFGGYNNGIASGGQLVVSTFTPADNVAPIEQHSSIELFSDAPIISFVCSTTAAFFNVIIDGVRWNQGGLPNSTSTAYYQTFDFSATGGRKTRHYRLEARALSRLSAIRVDPQSSVWAPSDVDKVTAVCISDSIFQGAAYGPHLPGNAISQRLGYELGWNDVWSFTQGGTGWITAGSGNAFDYRIPEALSLDPDVMIFMGSTNDSGQTTAALTARALSTLQLTRATGWQGLIYVFGILSVNDSGYAAGKKIADYENALLAAVTAFADPQCWFIPIRNDPTGPWITGAWNNSINTSSLTGMAYINATDNIHPCDLGHTFIALREAEAIRTKLVNAR